MTTQDTSRSKSPGFFSIYKPGQGTYVRWGTVGALGIVTAAAMWWAYQQVRYYNPEASEIVLAIVICAVAVFGAAIAFIIVNRPRPAEFMIMTESEMRKVTWPSRQTVVNSTKVVIFLTLLMAAILCLVDYGFVQIFRWMGVLSS